MVERPPAPEVVSAWFHWCDYLGSYARALDRIAQAPAAGVFLPDPVTWMDWTTTDLRRVIAHLEQTVNRSVI